jgi:hypothetical protein
MSESIDKDKLLKASDHLWYEIWMFQAVTNGILSGVSGAGPINNALLESFAVHVRALIHFFFDDDGKKDDVLANHFFNTKDEWHSVVGNISETLEKAKKRTDKEIVHLTYTRQNITPDEKPWALKEINIELNKVIEIFLRHVNQELLGQRWDKTLHRK